MLIFSEISVRHIQNKRINFKWTDFEEAPQFFGNFWLETFWGYPDFL